MPIRMAGWAAASAPTVKVASLASFSVATRAVMSLVVLAGGRASCSSKASRTLPVAASTRIQALAGWAPGGGAAWAPAGGGPARPPVTTVIRHSSAHTGAGEGRRGIASQARRPTPTVGGPDSEAVAAGEAGETPEPG